MAVNSKAPEFTETGENVRYAVEGDTLVVRIDLTHRNDVPDKDGMTKKTIRVATTRGNTQVPGTDVFLGINAYVYRIKR